MRLSEFSKGELITIANSLALAFSNQLSSEEISILSSFFTILGDILGLLSINSSE